MKRLLYILQILLKLGLVFSFCFIWTRFLINSIWTSITLSVGITIMFEIIHRIIQTKSKTRENLKIKEKEDADNMFLSLLTDNKYMTFYEDMLKSRHQNILTKKSFIIILKNNTKTILFPYLKLETLKPNNLLEIIRLVSSSKPNKITILCYDYDKETMAFLKNFKEDIILLDRYETYSLYKEYEFFPTITQEYKKEGKLSIKDLLCFAFNRSRTKGYLISAFILFITSFFVRINIYYCIISSLLLLFALISYINPKYNKKIEREII